MTKSGRFQKGGLYTRNDIHAVLGGGLGDFLPNKDGRVVCGCFTRQYNPDAPDIVLVGSGPNQMRAANLFCEQTEAVPVFMKLKSSCWEYIGDYAVDDVMYDPDALVEAEERAGWTGVSLIMRLTPATR